MTETISGTKEWATRNCSIIDGCSHNCRYCYAREMAIRFGRETEETWPTMRVRQKAVDKKWRKHKGRIFCFSTHDITPEFLEPCLQAIENILKPGNQVLIVSKPHLECIEAICSRFPHYRDQILFRFTVGALSDEILSYWEPEAPSLFERLDALETAYSVGYPTSVSCEPLLQPEGVERLVDLIDPFVSDSIWIGKMNKIRSRVVPGTDPAEIARIEAGQTDERVREIYQSLEGHRKVRLKESYKRVVGLELAEQPGMDV